ncbi:DNA internalization-related competence protein ComEC/Rec2 [Pulveribacter suum]|uniref:DNA internalization-related competence protein ComEC/Rec2 n=1 Tax=Pulveribacter suum TaxID=2116657 RepID=A0A2P1NN43_9BURK|nr:DNA internalization-related competence protein ComEC/Rec2 [Pulveribacter suum]AVP58471.1 DNA internalization-related competence protein ComEC/Rec2 [Pulveribacter suum]
MPAHRVARTFWLGTPALLGVVLGTALQLQLQQSALLPTTVYGAALTFGAAANLMAWLRDGRLAAALAGLGAAVLAWGLCGLRAAAFLAGALAPQLQGQDLRVTGVIAAMPQVRADGVRLRLAVESARQDGEAVRLPELVDLTWYAQGWRGQEVEQPPPALRAGERWQLTVRLKAPHGARNPHGFDYELWLWEQGVQAGGYVRTGAPGEPPRLLAATWRHPVEQLRQRVRDAILQRLAPADADPARRRAAGVVAALVTGDQRAIDRADWDVFRITGVAHLMSISGLHITLFAWLAAAVLRRAWSRSARLCLAVPAPSAALVGGVLLAGAYALFSGWGVPAQRTVLMLATVGLLRLSGRAWPWPQVWLLACAAVLLADPWALLQAGFWLSFVAVGMLFATDMRAASDDGAGAGGRFGLKAAQLLREQWVVTVALAPLTLLLFGQVSLVGLVANLVAIPWTTLVLTPLALAGVLWPPLWQAAAWSAELLGAWLQWLAGWPWAQLTLALAPLPLGMAAVAGGLLLVLRLPWGLRVLGLPLLLPALAWQVARPAAGQFDLLAADVGQGQAVLVRTAHHSLLYDAGPRLSATADAGERVLAPLLRALGERIDLLVLSHGDSDHTGGAAAVLAQQPGARVLGSIDGGLAPGTQVPVQTCAAGMRWQWDGVEFAVLHPPPGPAPEGRAARPNARSCVLRVAAAAGQGARAALLAGDIERAQEQALVEAGAELSADVLLVPHHGSKTSSSEAFIDAVAPRLALVQAGWRNSFGHPAPEVVQRYRARGIALAATPGCGAAAWQSADGRLRCERAATQRYWQHPPQEVDAPP